jgi:hypothetical protein
LDVGDPVAHGIILEVVEPARVKTPALRADSAGSASSERHGRPSPEPGKKGHRPPAPPNLAEKKIEMGGGRLERK